MQNLINVLFTKVEQERLKISEPVVQSVLDSLDKTARQVLALRFGLNGPSLLWHSEIAPVVKKGEQEIIRIKRDALLALKNGIEARQKILSMPIEEIPLNVRAKKALDAYGIKTVSDLLSKTCGELTKIPGFGKNALADTRAWLAESGLRLKGQHKAENKKHRPKKQMPFYG